MRFMLSIYTDEAEDAKMTAEEQRQMFAAYEAFGREARASGVMQTGEALQPTGKATTVRVRDGQTVTSGGPAVKTVEQFGGFYILDCRDANEAIAFAAKIPGAAAGSVEVRPLWEFE